MYKKASMTVFLGMTIVAILSLFFSLVELIHVDEITKQINLSSELGIQSTFADYNRFLWDTYDVLAVDTGYCNSNMDMQKVETRMARYVNDNCNGPGLSFLKSRINECKIEEFGLITDNYGAPLIKEAAKAILIETPEIVLGEYDEAGDDVKDKLEDGIDVERMIDEADDSLKNASLPEESDSSLVPTDPTFVAENPVEIIKEWKSNGVLAQVLESGQAVSDRHLISNSLPSNRSCNRGNLSKTQDVSASEKALFGVYLKEKLSNYTSDLSHIGLSYEWEYVLCGEKTDRENLEAIVKKLLAAREVENLASLLKDPVKVSQAASLAASIAAWTANPAIVEAVKWGIIAAWAYVESVLDVRLLLRGGKVSVMKTSYEWTSQILNITAFLSPSVKAKNCESGLDYEGYLMVLTYLKSAKELGSMTLDLIENALNSTNEYMNVKVDNMMYEAKARHIYEADPIFLSIIVDLRDRGMGYQYVRTPELSYISSD